MSYISIIIISILMSTRYKIQDTFQMATIRSTSVNAMSSCMHIHLHVVISKPVLYIKRWYCNEMLVERSILVFNQMFAVVATVCHLVTIHYNYNVI